MSTWVGPDGLFGWSWQLLAAALTCLAALALVVSLVISRRRWARLRVLLGISLLVGALVLAGFAPVPGPVPRAAPVSADARYYTAEPLGEIQTPQAIILRAFSARSGAALWQYHPAAALDVGVWVLGATPTTVVAYEDTSPQAHVVALDAADGRVRWRFDVERSDIPPTRLLPEGDLLAIGTPSQVVGVALATGEVRWRYIVPAGVGVEQPLLAVGNTLLVRAAAGAPYSAAGVHLFALGTQDGTLHWQADLGMVAPPVRRAIAVAESGVICVVTGSGEPGSGQYQYGMAAFDVHTGTALWQHALAPEEFALYPYSGEVFASGNTCYVMDEQGILALDASTGTPRFTLPGATISSPRGSTVRFTTAFADDAMLFVVAGPTHAGLWGIETVYAIGATDGRVKWRVETDSRETDLALSPQRDALYVSASKLMVLSAADGHVRWETSRQLTIGLDPADAAASPALSAAIAAPGVTFLMSHSPTCVLFCGDQQMYLWAVATTTGMPYWRVPLGPPEKPLLGFPFH